MDHHTEGLQSLCRLCGGRVAHQKGLGTTYPVNKYQFSLWTKYNIDVGQDSPQIHPPKFCHKCYCQLSIHMSASWVPKNNWSPHRRTGVCPSCILYQASTRKGRPLKKKHGGRPPKTKAGSPQEHLQELKANCPSTSTPFNVDFALFELEESNSFLFCCVCKNVVSCPVETPCHHLICVDCMSPLFCKVAVNCPVCSTNVHYTQVTLPAPYIHTLITNLNIICKHCHTSMPHTSSNNHACTTSRIQHNDHTYPKFNTSKPLDTFTSRQIEHLGATIIHNKFTQSDDGQTASFNLPGQRTPLIARQIPKSTKCSNICNQSTLRKRTKLLEDVRSTISIGQSSSQLKDEVKSREAELESILPASISIKADDVLQLKGFFGFSWARLRKLKRWLKARNVFTSHEGGIRKVQENIIDGNLQSEWVPLQVTDEETKTKGIAKAPLITVISLEAKVQQLLDKYDELDELTWHDGCIPESEVWLKVGGDKGGKTFKMVLQVANVERPNSLANTQIIGLFEGSDSPYNLHIALKSLQHELAHLESCTWRGKTLRIFHFGDYEYLTKVYGLTGPNGRHCCLYCKISKQQMLTPPSQRPPTQPRTLDTMANSLLLFKEKQIAKEAWNVIQEPMFKIPIDQVCPPGLHVSLGLYLKHFNALEKECHKLDLQIAELLAKSGEEQPAYKDAFKQRMEKCKMEEKLEELSQDIPELTDQHNLFTFYYPECEPPAVIMQAIEEKTREKERLTHAASKIPMMPLWAGPVTSLLDEVLQSIQVHRQASHGRSFVGNHVHKCLKPENVNKLMTAIVQKVQEILPNSPTLHAKAQEMSDSYKELFQRYASCHNVFNSGKFLSNQEIDKLEHDIKAYMLHFRDTFPKETVPPKMHLLEDHTVPWLRQWKAAFGFMGEQGGEAVHARLNLITNDLRGYHDLLKKSMQSVRTQWVQSNPVVYHQQTEELKLKTKSMKR